jgi:hypothetical protein
MTPDQIRQLAQQAGFQLDGDLVVTDHKEGICTCELQAFANLVRNATIEECAAKCDDLIEPSVELNDVEYCLWQVGTEDCAKEIRGMK